MENEGPESDEDLFALQPLTLAALTSFLDEQAAEFEEMVSLTTRSYPASSNSTDLQLDCDEAEVLTLNKCKDQNDPNQTNGLDILGPRPQSQAVPVDTFKKVFKENWQLSQFWYTQDTAERLAQAIQRVCLKKADVAFVCCPTGYVAFKEVALPSQISLLLEYDRRFSIVAGADFVQYDLNEPLSFPRMDDLRNSQDIVVVDPPFHSEDSQKNIALTITHLLRPGGRLILLTGLSLSSLIESIYHFPLPLLRRRAMVVEHDGVGRLVTPYGCWTGGGPDGQDEDGFGELVHDELY